LPLKRAAGRADVERAFDRRFEAAPDRDIERQTARLHFDS
jgi:hypothetical protein